MKAEEHYQVQWSPHMTDLAIATQNLRKVYGGRPGRPGFVAVQDLSLQVPQGQVFGFLGPNGAGKTTTINMLLGNIYPTAGRAELLGRPVGDREVRAPPRLSAREVPVPRLSDGGGVSGPARQAIRHGGGEAARRASPKSWRSSA